MATTKKPKAKKPKVIVWKKVATKATAPHEKKLNKLFADFNKEASKRPMSTRERNDLWAKKYEKKYNALEKALTDAIDKLWLKYHVSTGTTTPKPGYIIK